MTEVRQAIKKTIYKKVSINGIKDWTSVLAPMGGILKGIDSWLLKIKRIFKKYILRFLLGISS